MAKRTRIVFVAAVST